MEAVREVTVWTGIDYAAPNHDYLLDGDRVIAYRPWGTAEIRVLSGRIKIDRRGRKFLPLTPNPFSTPKAARTTTVEVLGSKGQTYLVDTEAQTCTCQGFTFRGTCKHIKELV
jgi:hypothetical protein